ncbi:CUB and sushi domain-containing protein 1 [Orchesella cincta]|uniref:CUB and sushi domain-containing protein 1 n=2 Tax=Orchesella cincta TaxID=48709 RepID=A0A1D2MCE3_ORCCI|nr:CUB and sushi domain-containing protein 1 [Orchesella cincta]
MNRPTNQSSTASSASHGKNSSHLANDGMTETCSSTQKEVNPFWIVDMLQIHQITGVRISNTGKEEQDSEVSVDLEIRVGNNPVGLKNPLCAWQPGANLHAEEKYLECARPLSGRYVSIQIIGEGALKMCEVQVFAIDGVPKARCAPELKASDDVLSFNGTCFEFATKSGQTFSGARSQCLARNGDLPSEIQLKPNSPNLHFITTTLDRLKATLKRPLIWIGVERDPGFTARSWRWVDSGYVVKKPMWGKDQPNNYNGEQNCAVLDGQREWSWNDVGCGLDYFHWICVFPPNSCGSPDRQAGTEITNEGGASYKVGATLIYKCSGAGHFMHSGSKIRVCQRNGMWNGTAPQCKYINCGCGPLHQTLEHGKVILPTKNETYYGAEISYECDEGYTIARGSNIRSCGSDEKWSGAMPQCLMSSCSPPSEIVNGTFVSTGTNAGSTVTYRCNPGHILIGSASLTCQLGGKYDNEPPTCKYVTCGDMPSLEHGEFRLVNSTAGVGNIPELGSLAIAHCVDNYELTDPDYDRIVCSEQGTWRSLEDGGRRVPSWENLIKCTIIVCDEPEVPHGSFVTGYDFTVGSEIQYHCEEGHKMIGGNEIRRCTHLGEWSGAPPECKYIDCGRAQTIPFGQVSYFSGKTHLGSVVQYSCAPNYRLNGPGNRTCNVNGHWSGNTPKCEEIRCSYPPIPPAAVATVSKNDRFNAQTILTSESTSSNTTTFRIGSILKYRCERGYKLLGDHLRSCEDGGEWSVINNPECIFVDCKPPQPFNNGEVKLTSNATYFGSTAIYECWNGFKLVGNARRSCLENASWSGKDPHCRGQYLIGDSTRRCSDHGIWAGQVPYCQFTVCQAPPDSRNTRKFLVNATTIYSSIVEYHCVPGYKLLPNTMSVLTCTEFGTWSPPTPPTCLSPEESPEIFKRVEASQESSSSIVGIVIGIIIGLFVIIALVVVLLYVVKRSGQDKSQEQDRASRTETLKAEPMVVFPSQQQNYYDNPTVDPIYENLDDYGVTSSAASVVTINGVAVS